MCWSNFYSRKFIVCRYAHGTGRLKEENKVKHSIIQPLTSQYNIFNSTIIYNGSNNIDNTGNNNKNINNNNNENNNNNNNNNNK